MPNSNISAACAQVVHDLNAKYALPDIWQSEHPTTDGRFVVVVFHFETADAKAGSHALLFFADDLPVRPIIQDVEQGFCQFHRISQPQPQP